MTDAWLSPPPRINLLASALDLLHEVQVLRAALDRQIDRLDRLEKEIRVVIAFLRGTAKVSDLHAGGLAADQAAHSLIISRLPDDSAEVCVDGGEAFRLPPLLAGLVDFLAKEGDARGVQFFGWKTREEIQVWLALRTGKKARRQYVNNLVSRLRARFTKAGVDSALIQTHRRKGVRLSVKYLDTQVTEGDS